MNFKIRNFCEINFSFRYIDDVLSLNNPNFKDYLHLIYPSELEIKETTDNSTSASYLDLYLYIDNTGRLKSKLYDKRVLFVFHFFWWGWEAFVLFTEYLINIYLVIFILLENKRHFLHVISMYKKQPKTKQKTPQMLSAITNHTYKYHNTCVNNTCSSINISECQYSLVSMSHLLLGCIIIFMWRMRSSQRGHMR